MSLIWRLLGVAQRSFLCLEPPALLVDAHAGRLCADSLPVTKEPPRVAA